MVMTTTQESPSRNHDRLVTQLRSVLQVARDEVAAAPPKMVRLSKRTLTYERHGFIVDIHVEIEPNWRRGTQIAPLIDQFINMAIGAADRFDARGEFRFSPRAQDGVSVYIVAEACGRR